jgi:hypothetical protein
MDLTGLAPGELPAVFQQLWACSLYPCHLEWLDSWKEPKRETEFSYDCITF